MLKTGRGKQQQQTPKKRPQVNEYKSIDRLLQWEVLYNSLINGIIKPHNSNPPVKTKIIIKITSISQILFSYFSDCIRIKPCQLMITSVPITNDQLEFFWLSYARWVVCNPFMIPIKCPINVVLMKQAKEL